MGYSGVKMDPANVAYFLGVCGLQRSCATRSELHICYSAACLCLRCWNELVVLQLQQHLNKTLQQTLVWPCKTKPVPNYWRDRAFIRNKLFSACLLLLLFVFMWQVNARAMAKPTDAAVSNKSPRIVDTGGVKRKPVFINKNSNYLIKCIYRTQPGSISVVLLSLPYNSPKKFSLKWPLFSCPSWNVFLLLWFW